MIHFGVVSPPVLGHVHPFAALGRELIARGHRVTFFQVCDLEEKILAEQVGFAAIGEQDHPRGSLPESLALLSRLHGVGALRFTIQAVARASEMILRDAPAAMRAAHIEVLLVDQMEPAGGAIAEHLGIPFVTVCNALPINRDAGVPPPFTNWKYSGSSLAALRNWTGYEVSNWMLRPVVRIVARQRRAWKLPALESPEDSFSKLAQISQLPREFDFPRTGLPASFHYTGPLRRPISESMPFPWERLDGRPLVYASLGTLQNRREDLFRCFAEVCHSLDLQLAIGHGGSLSAEQADALPGHPVAVAFAPQVQLLARAQLTITHAGLNTVLDSLANGVPLVAVPITYEQPAIARRIEYCGSGRMIPLARVHVGSLREAVKDVLAQAHYRESARRMAAAIQRAGGVRNAADVVEGAVAR